MEHTIKLPKNLSIGSLASNGVPESHTWASMSGKKYLYLCRARDVHDTGTSYWSVALFAGGSVNLGITQYATLQIASGNGDGYRTYSDDFTVRYEEAELVTIPCICFDEDTEYFKGEVVGFFKDGDCAVVKSGDMRVLKIDPSKVKYISDILEME